MYLSTVTVIVSGAGIVLAHPFKNVAREVASFPAGASWDILLNSAAVGNIKKISDQSFSIIDIDLFDTDSQTIADLKSTKTVICYFSAGTREEWRPDAGDFKSGDVGKNMEEWAGEAWLNVKSDSVRKIMQNRIKQAADKGCQAIDPDNTDGFVRGNQDGFGYGKAVYVDYLRFLAQEAKSNGLAIGLKNSLDIIPDLVDVMSFAINEQCHQYKECAQYKPFTDQNKAVFNIEYGGNACDNPAGVKLSTLIKPEDQGLNSLGGACAGQNPGTPETKPSSTPRPSSSTVPTPTKPAEPSQTPSKTPTPISSPSSKPSPPVSSSAPSQVPTKTSTPSSSAVTTQTPSKTRGPARPTPTKDTEKEEDDKEEEEEEEEEEKSKRPWWQWWRSHN